MCYDNHLKDGSYKKKNKKLCDVVKLCNRCNKVTNCFRSKHTCGMIWCKYCKRKHFINELCYMQPISNEVNHEKKFCLFFMILRGDRMSLILIARLQICTFQIYVLHSKRARIASMMTMFRVGVILVAFANMVFERTLSPS